MGKEWPSVLYHYTSSHVLLSILQSQSIWLGSQQHLNDSNEGKVFVQHLRSYAKDKGIEGTNIDAVIENLNSLKFYVNCMTSEADLLSQWRGYAANGAGVSIGFKTTTLLNVIGGSSDALLLDVIYADDYTDLDKRIQTLIAALVKSNNPKGDGKTEFVQSVAKEMWAVKNKAFQEEHEYRLILTLDRNAPEIAFKSGATAKRKYRASDIDVRDYYELSFKPINPTEILHEIVLGPKNKSDPDAVRCMLDDMGFNNVSIRKSVASYR